MDTHDKQDIVRAVGNLEGTLGTLVDRFDAIDRKLEVVGNTCERFENYREARKDLPEKVEDLARKTATCQSNCTHRTQKTEDYFKKTDYLMMWSYKISGAQMIISILAAAIVILVQLKIL